MCESKIKSFCFKYLYISYTTTPCQKFSTCCCGYRKTRDSKVIRILSNIPTEVCPCSCSFIDEIEFLYYSSKHIWNISRQSVIIISDDTSTCITIFIPKISINITIVVSKLSKILPIPLSCSTKIYRRTNKIARSAIIIVCKTSSSSHA